LCHLRLLLLRMCLLLLKLLQLPELCLLQQHMLLLCRIVHSGQVRQVNLCYPLALQQLLELQCCSMRLLQLLLLYCNSMRHALGRLSRWRRSTRCCWQLMHTCVPMGSCCVRHYNCYALHICWVLNSRLC
jgi:hypothetical protein